MWYLVGFVLLVAVVSWFIVAAHLHDDYAPDDLYRIPYQPPPDDWEGDEWDDLDAEELDVRPISYTSLR